VPAGASGGLFLGCDGVADRELVVRFEDCRLVARPFQIGSQIPRITMLPARRTPRKTTIRIIARRDIRPLERIWQSVSRPITAFEKNLSRTMHFGLAKASRF